MKNKKILIFSSIGLVAAAAVTCFAVFSKKPEAVSGATARQIILDSDTKVENWYTSGKGLSLDFTFNVPAETSVNSFCFLNTDKDWKVLQGYYNLTFDILGNVTADYGKIYKYDDHYTYIVMFDEFSNPEIPNGKLDSLYSNNYNVPMDILSMKLVDSYMDTFEKAYIRDSSFKNGLTFKSYIRSLNQGSTYGMIIVPSSYVGAYTSDFHANYQANGVKFLDFTCEPNVMTPSMSEYSTYGAGYYIQATISDIKLKNYQEDFVGIPYEKKSDGTYVYGNNFKERSNNLYRTCYDIKRNGGYVSLLDSTKKYIDEVISTIDDFGECLDSSMLTPYVVPNSLQVMKNADKPTIIFSELIFNAGRGETETGQLMLYGNHGISNKKFFVGISNLKNTANNAVLDNTYIETSMELYQNIKSNWSTANEHSSYYGSNYYPNGAESLSLGYFPDALLPMELAVQSGRNVLNTSNGRNQGIFFKINIPRSATAGTYTGKVIINVQDGETLCLPITLNVIDMTHDEQNHSNFIATVNRYEFENIYGNDANPQDYANPYLQNAIKFINDRKIGAGEVGESCWDTTFLDRYAEKVREFTLDKNQTKYLLYTPNVSVSGTYRYKKPGDSSSTTVSLKSVPVVEAKDGSNHIGLETILEKLVNESTNEVDLLSKAMIVLPSVDEPATKEAYFNELLCNNSVRCAIDFVLAKNIFAGKDKVKQSLQNLKYFITLSLDKSAEKNNVNSNYFKGISEVISVYSVSESAASCYCDSVSSIKLNNLKNNGVMPQIIEFTKNSAYKNNINNFLADSSVETWWYSAILPVAPYPSYVINAPMLRSRANRWLQYSKGVVGEYYWSSNKATKYTELKETIKLTEEEILNGEATFASAYGDGLLIYPVHNMFKAYNNNVFYLSSLRLENIQEGVDDYNAIYLASSLIDNLNDETLKNQYRSRLTTLVSNIGTDVNNLTKDSYAFDINRLELYRLIEELY